MVGIIHHSLPNILVLPDVRHHVIPHILDDKFERTPTNFVEDEASETNDLKIHG